MFFQMYRISPGVVILIEEEDPVSSGISDYGWNNNSLRKFCRILHPSAPGSE
jgi:hypothetical protein